MFLCKVTGCVITWKKCHGPKAKKETGSSLFPFLDILACVIGNLILIITAVVLESVDSDKLAEQFANEAVQATNRAESTGHS